MAKASGRDTGAGYTGRRLRTNPRTAPPPGGAPIPASKPTQLSVKIKRDTRATRSMMYLWTVEVPSDGRGFRVLGTGREGTFKIPQGLAINLPNVLSLRLAAMNANGKVYLVDKVYKLVP